MTEPRDQLTQAAVEYAEAEIPIFPVFGILDGACTCKDGSSCKRPGKHPMVDDWPGWARDIDPEKVARFWYEHPEANIGLATGGDLFAVDVDVRADKDGRPAWMALANRNGGVPETAASDTGGGGVHYVFGKDEWISVGNAQALRDGDHVIRGIDIRGDGGYIVVEPSRHISGGQYRWSRSIYDSIQPAPAWLLDLVSRPQTATYDGTPVPSGTTRTPSIVSDFEIRKIETALSFVPATIGNNEGWQTIMFALHDHFVGSEQGWNVLSTWSSGAPSYDEREVRRRWISIPGRDRGSVGIASLYAIAFQHGGQSAKDAVMEIERERLSQLAVVELVEMSDPDDVDLDHEPGLWPVDIVGRLEGPMAVAIDWMVCSNPKQDPILAMPAALAMFAAGTGRKLAGPSGARSNCIFVGIAPSGTGKEAPQRCMQSAIEHSASRIEIIESIGHHVAQIDASLLRHSDATCLLALDEYGGLLTSLLRSKDVGRSAELAACLRKLITTTSGTHKLARLGPRHPDRAENIERWDAGVIAPWLAICGYSTPDQFFRAFTEESLHDGLVGRHVIFESDGRSEFNPITEMRVTDVPAPIMEWFGCIDAMPQPQISPRAGAAEVMVGAEPMTAEDRYEMSRPKHPSVIPFADEDTEQTFLAMLQARHAASMSSEADSPLMGALTRRSLTTISAVALVLACAESADPTKARIEEGHIEVAAQLVDWSVHRIAWQFRHGEVAMDPFGKRYERLIQRIERRRHEPNPWCKVSKIGHPVWRNMPPREQQALRQALEADASLVWDERKTWVRVRLRDEDEGAVPGVPRGNE